MNHLHDAALRARLVTNLRSRRALDDADARRAAVTLPIADVGGAACLLITKRSHLLRRNPGQWALPGGRVDTGESAHDAALRELDEELGIAATAAEVLGELDDYRSRTGFLITPVVVWLADGVTPVPNAAEVASVHELTLDELDRDGEPRFVDVEGADGPVIQLPILGTRIHAPTAAILYQFRERGLHGRDVDSNAFHEPPFAWR